MSSFSFSPVLRKLHVTDESSLETKAGMLIVGFERNGFGDLRLVLLALLARLPKAAFVEIDGIKENVGAVSTSAEKLRSKKQEETDAGRCLIRLVNRKIANVRNNGTYVKGSVVLGTSRIFITDGGVQPRGDFVSVQNGCAREFPDILNDFLVLFQCDSFQVG
jgi:hypothetical protein